MKEQLLRVPSELRELNNWCLWKYEDVGAKKPTKVPYSIKGDLANVNNSSTWASFEECCLVFDRGGYSGIGFVFSDEQNYSFIDLDDTEGDKVAQERQIKVFKEFDSYSEVSPSGKGLHIIVKGKIPQGRRRSHIEIYSSQRYATMTGQVYNDKPIQDRNELLNLLFKQMGGSPNVNNYTGDEKETESDEAIIERAIGASNGDKFAILLSGNWNGYYGSQSEADFAFIDIIAFYTQNRLQIARMFRSSPLGQRAKANRKDYVEYMINKSFDRLLPKIDFDGFRIALEEKIANGQVEAKNTSGASIHSAIQHNDSDPAVLSVPGHTITPPSGLLGEIARFIYEAAPRPVPEIALAAAIGLMAGVCGRAYNISGTGLNQYVLLIAMTGAGKEAMASGIDKLINAVTMSVPVAPEFIGPSKIASGQALYKYLANSSQSFVSIMGEFGKRLDVMSSKTANSAEKQLVIEFLDLYNKSGFGQQARQSIYADKDKNTLSISAPAFSILGETTPDSLYGTLTEEMISDGLLPRFMLIEYKGGRPALNEHHSAVQPSIVLVEKLAQLMANAKTVMANRKVTNVDRTPEAAKMLAKFDKLADSRINTAEKDAIRQLWNRAHIKVLKIAGLIAVGNNFINPVVDVEDVKWAMDIVEHDIKALSAKFEAGEVGKNIDEIKQFKELQRVMKEFIVSDWDKVKSYCNDQRLHSAKLVPHSYLGKRLPGVAAFKNDKQNPTIAIKRTIQNMIDGDFIRETPRKDMIEKFGTTQKAYVISNMSMLD